MASQPLETPIACTLTADELRAAARDLLPGLIGQAVEIRERADGISLRFDAAGDIVQRIAGVIDRERQCCAFFRFRLTIEPAAGPVWLDVSGPEGTRELLLQLQQVGGSVSDDLERTEPGGVR
ncbi:MAG TPA: hypothetical protein VJ672_12295 [Gemmatimonadaceae bacterium]|nr:hypothetical protein [Gemmatimonadaceae bacterium]